ncbi:MAG: hypothetical protein DWQ47_11370 [Acidobacteria bacterium]|nr:MAG: hypothetical protein DWQ32_13785 [Acidobacteriota bacterium]REJ98177.1 MAG: hypothetical protein DWQ38_16585 [Acidobacteriota bacterium]REK16920.1 MAG: hypothetical protein DWQ43_01630 [Acidobacteriota bacterium]REK42831.1 MAG: hypothetical protein DWQ47_11370 [Acidobacteriota bacterium]
MLKKRFNHGLNGFHGKEEMATNFTNCTKKRSAADYTNCTNKRFATDYTDDTNWGIRKDQRFQNLRTIGLIVGADKRPMKVFRFEVCVLLLALALFSSCTSEPENRTGRAGESSPVAGDPTPVPEPNAVVVRVADGDSITVRFLDTGKEERVRLATIDAPENGQAYGEQAKKSLSDLVKGKNVLVVELDRDQYRRIVGEVFIGSINVNVEQLRRGFAWHYKQHERQQDPDMRARYAGTEQLARQTRAGLWRDQNPVPPWNWRKESTER